MAESSDRALPPDETAHVTAARDKAFVDPEPIVTFIPFVAFEDP
jgi:hypothetical protein